MIDLLSYAGTLRELRNSPYIRYPLHVHVETYALCNAACGFCPYSVLDRKGQRMSDDLVEKIVADLTQIPATVPFQLSPFKVNEPFLDTRLFEILSLVNEKLPNAQITLTTNASPLTERHLSRLREIRSLAYVWVSVNECTKDEYESVMKLPFERTRQRLSALHEWKRTAGAASAVVLSRVGDGSERDEAFRSWVEREYPLFRPFIGPRGSWLGQVDLETGAVPNAGCQRWFELSITATGTVAHCCMDGQCRWPVGNVRTQSVLEIYNSPEYRRLRESIMTRRAFDPCRQCTFV
jgi:radical SAM protein with 4Fe4S-binding SPASM domain